MAGVVLGQCLDELPPQTRRLLEELDRLVALLATKQGIERSAVRFTRREVREHTRLSNTQLRVHLGQIPGNLFAAYPGLLGQLSHAQGLDLQLMGATAGLRSLRAHGHQAL